MWSMYQLPSARLDGLPHDKFFIKSLKCAFFFALKKKNSKLQHDFVGRLKSNLYLRTQK